MKHVANVIIFVVLVAGVGWTLTAALWLGRPDIATCRLIYPQMQDRPVIALVATVVVVALMTIGAPEMPWWKRLLYLLGLVAFGHLVWPQD